MTAPVVPGAETETYLSRNVRQAFIGLFVFIAFMNVLGFLFEMQIVKAGDWVFAHLGFQGLWLLAFLIDVIVSPVPPEIVLVLMSKSAYGDHWLLVTLGFGLGSAAAGCLDYWLGRWLGATSWGAKLTASLPEQTRGLVNRYGVWGVAAGALTPIPFSLTCWAAGLFQIDFPGTALMCLLRVPRFAVSYLVILTAL